MRIRDTRFVALVVVAALVASCNADNADVPRGTAHGHVVQVGGPPGPPNINLPATVVVTRSGLRVATAETTATGFSFTLAPGKYRFKASAPNHSCEGCDVTITTAADITVLLGCRVK